MKSFDYRLRQYTPAMLFLFALGVIFPYAFIALAALVVVMLLDVMFHL